MIVYELTRKKVKNVNLRIRGDGKICISARAGVPLAFIDSFVLKNADRIIGNVDKLSEIAEKKAVAVDFCHGDTVILRGIPLTVAVQWDVKESGCADFDAGQFRIYTPYPESREARVKIGEKVCIEDGIQRIASAVEEIYPVFSSLGFAYPGIKFRKMRSCWGNCRTDTHTLTFNTGLCYVPDDCLRLVVAHELTHFLHPDHSPEFHADLEKVIPGHRQIRRKLKEYEYLLQ